jgi:SAM-dependent methyltransferase
MNLNQNDLERLKKFYDEALEKYGPDDARSVQWTSLYNQLGRFQALLNVVPVEKINGRSLLDVGCGLGDLYYFLIKNGIETTYTGIDILPEFIQSAEKKFAHFSSGELKDRIPSKKLPAFFAADILNLERVVPDPHFDYVFCSGALSFKVDNNQEYYFGMLEKMYSFADKALAFNMLDLQDHVDDDTYAAYSPIEASEFCRTFCDHVEILTDYLPQDFTVFCYKN